MNNFISIIKKNQISILLSFVCFLSGLFLGYYICYTHQRINKDGSEAQTVNKDEGDTQGQEKDICVFRAEISGAVKRPNVYCLEEGSILLDLIEKSGGYTKDYAKYYVEAEINLAKVLQPNEKVYIPKLNEVKCEKYQYLLSRIEATNNQKNTLGKSCVNINTATIEGLTTLSGIGESYAKKIIDGRPYKSIQDLKNVSGIGDQTFEKIQNEICI